MNNKACLIYNMGNMLGRFKNNQLDIDTEILHKKIDRLQQENKNLNDKLNEYTAQLNNNGINNITINNKEIENLVDSYLENENINCGYIPDYVEKKIYTNVLQLTTGLLLETLNTSNLKILGQTIKFSINPEN